MGFPSGSGVKKLLAVARDVGDAGLIPGSGRSLRGGNGNTLQYSCCEIPWTEEPGRLQSRGSQRDSQSSLSECVGMCNSVIQYIKSTFLHSQYIFQVNL